MRKLFTLLFLFLLAVNSFGNNTELFEYNESEIASELQDLSAIESLVSEKNITFDELTQMDENLIDKTQLSSEAIKSLSPMEPPLGIPSFLWGCIFGIVGVIAVYLLTDEDKSETKKAAFGMLATIGGVVVFYIIYFFVVIGFATSTI